MKIPLKIVIGRSHDCDYVIFDPKNRVSRKHLEVLKKIDYNDYIL